MGIVTTAGRVLLAAVLLGACLRPGEERALLDLEVGTADTGGARVTVADGLAAVRSALPGELVLWAQAPSLHLQLTTGANAERAWVLVFENVPADAVLRGQANRIDELGSPRPTVRRFAIEIEPGTTASLELSPADASVITPWRFAFMADIQEGIDRVHELLARVKRDPTIRFLLVGGDLVDRGSREEMDAVLSRMEALDVPFYATPGNHELFQDDRLWHSLIGRRNVHFAFRGAFFSLVDSGNASLDPLVYEQLAAWLERGRNDVHIFVTHIPPFDPVGVRNGSFRSRREAAKLYNMLAQGQVDVALLAHVHSYYAFSVAGIPSFISGGGGARPSERLDGIGRHYLTIDVDPVAQHLGVEVVRVD